ncbi:hypothetical protein ACPER7_00060 [Acinetobacter dispersus]|uniref:hypothetical protein n=1 Tax=Acinetobacter dispersus TaxID=70348 RepID=UPI003C2C1723
MLNTINDGAKALLKDTASILEKFPEVQYLVIGGWCPVLRNTTKLNHPGTIDVDILFKESYKENAIQNVIESFLSEGFLPSAKHSFQLLKTYTIKNKEYVYNIDLLHPRMLEESNGQGMFVDHLDLDVPLNEHEAETKKMRSIILPNSKLLFDHNLFSQENINDTVFNLISFEGMFLTKMDSCQKQKRERDSFDIYLGFLGDNIDINQIMELSKIDNRIEESLSKFKEFLEDPKQLFNNNVHKYCSTQQELPSKLILNKFPSSI